MLCKSLERSLESPTASAPATAIDKSHEINANSGRMANVTESTFSGLVEADCPHAVENTQFGGEYRTLTTRNLT
jgi:hypothetical protein